MGAVIYCRVSRKEQVQNFSLGTQEAGCREFCEREGLPVLRVFVERGESAKTVDRTEFQRMLAWCERHRSEVDFVVVYNLSRFARNQLDHLAVRETLRKMEIMVRSVTEPVDDSPIGAMLEGVLSAVHQFENDLRAERAVSGMKSALRSGKWCWHAPIGYQWQDGRLEPDPEKSICIQHAFESVANGEAPAAVWNRARSRGLNIARSDFYKLLRRSIYAGWVESNAWGIRATGEHEPIVDQGLWDQVQLRLDGCGRVHAGRTDDFPLRGFIRCAKCESAFTAGWSKGRSRRYGYYRCACTGGNVRHDQVENRFVQLLRAVRPTKGNVRLFRAVLQDIMREDQAQSKQRTTALRRRLQTLERRRQRLVETYIYNQAIGRETYDAELARLNHAEVRARSEIDTTEQEQPDAEDLLSFAESIALRCDRLWKELDGEGQRSFQRFVFPGGVVLLDGKFLNPETSLLFKGDPAGSGGGISSGRGERTRIEPVAFLRSVEELRQTLGMVA